MMTPEQIGGILPVLYSFFDDDGELRLDGYRHQVEHCMNNGAGGVVLFGFVTQFYRLSFSEKIEAMHVTRAALGPSASLGITVMEQTPATQAELIAAAEAEGADWLILQPPLGPPVRPADWVAMLRGLITETTLPTAIQNAAIANPQLANDDIVALQAHCPNLVAVKAETSTDSVADFLQQQGDKFRVITGDWGLEYPFFLRHGAHGLIPAPNFVPEQVALHTAAQAGDWDTVDQQHAKLLPLLNFVRGRPDLEAQMFLGKQAYCWRNNYDPGVNRAPSPLRMDARLLDHAQHLTAQL